MNNLTHPADKALFDAAPTLIKPSYGDDLPLLALGRKRYINASDGLYLQTNTNTLNASICIAHAQSQLPYGELSEEIILSHGLIPASILSTVIDRSLDVSPKEWAGIIIFSEKSGYQLLEPELIKSEIGLVQYKLPEFDGDMVVDIHSHGTIPAYFSNQDDTDERLTGGVHFSMVVGSCGKEKVEISARLSIDGTFKQLKKLPFCESLTTLDRYIITGNKNEK